ncbi:MAG TPA: protein translocase subunit SecD [bacterium]|nr:protein translocase subunit SecD [bacterium]
MARKRRFYGLIGWLVFVFALVFALPTTGLLDGLSPELTQWLPVEKVKLGLDLSGGMVMRYEADMTNVPPGDEQVTLDTVLEIIRRRVDEFGVAEPEVEQIGDAGITVRLPGISDTDRAKNLIGERAVLEFMLVDAEGRLGKVLAKAAGYPTYRTILANVYDLGHGIYAPSSLKEGLAKMVNDRGLVSDFPGYRLALSVEQRLDKDSADYEQEIAQRLTEVYGSPVEGYFQLYLLDARRPIKGSDLTDAQYTRERERGLPAVSFSFNYTGAESFREVTGTHVGNQLAIVLDDEVISAPVIEEEIPGEGIIRGNFTVDRAKDLAINLRNGALPVALNVVMEDTIGPSLGSDSIKYGVTAALVGLLLVMGFMSFWYRFSGVIAVVALLFNIVLIIAALAIFGATLTLPGIAGIILTIGMSVDANVLIFERIREELRKGERLAESGAVKPAVAVATAINAGYDKAFITILDANITTLITAGVLYVLGTGPIRGFAVTLAIGIAASMFTALIVSRAIFDYRVRRRHLEKLSI